MGQPLPHENPRRSLIGQPFPCESWAPTLIGQSLPNERFGRSLIGQPLPHESFPSALIGQSLPSERFDGILEGQSVPNERAPKNVIGQRLPFENQRLGRRGPRRASRGVVLLSEGESDEQESRRRAAASGCVRPYFAQTLSIQSSCPPINTSCTFAAVIVTTPRLPPGTATLLTETFAPLITGGAVLSSPT
jgi:hypothetical protein